jgi:ABC-type amino acid transport substrate-binding protein
MDRRTFLAALAATPLAPRPAAAKGVLRVGSALPDPPFELRAKGGAIGFDIELTRLIARRLGRAWQLVPYEGRDFNGIFAGLADGTYDVVASGTTITRGRADVVDFCAPYAVSGQSLVVNPRRLPHVRSTADLAGLTIGVQAGNTSQPVADRLVAEGRAKAVRVYAYDAIDAALDDVAVGRCDSFMKLAPVMGWLLRTRPTLRMVQTGITCEFLGISVRKADLALKADIDRIQDDLAREGILGRLIKRWLGAGAAPVSGAAGICAPATLKDAFR